MDKPRDIAYALVVIVLASVISITLLLLLFYSAPAIPSEPQNPFSVGDKVMFLGKVGVVRSSGENFNRPDEVWVQFLMTGPGGERLEEHLFHFKQLTLVQE